MIRLNCRIVSWLFMGLFIAQTSFSLLFSSDDNRSHVEYTPQKPSSRSYGGVRSAPMIPDVKLSAWVSLGGACISKVRQTIESADEFVAVFMYRFNSPELIKALEAKTLSSIPVLTFLDYHQTYSPSGNKSSYRNYVERLMNKVPTSLVKLASKNFHQKVIICKKHGEQAITIVGSANATFEADNMHSEDLVFIQNNELAANYLEAFGELFRSDPSSQTGNRLTQKQKIQIFHEHRLRDNVSNIDQLNKFQALLQSTDQMSMESAYTGNILDLGISTGFSKSRGTVNCLEIIQQALAAEDNSHLLLFENYISLKEQQSKIIHDSLTNDTDKLIVLDDNEYNKAYQESLVAKNNTVLLFKPFTGQKFHHKLMIRYPLEEEPIVYTGSFHIATNAINNDSESVIAIQSAALADDILSQILANSGLGENPQIWDFIHQKFSITDNPLHYQKLLHTAAALKKEVQRNSNRYKDRLERIYAELYKTTDDGVNLHFFQTKIYDRYIHTFIEEDAEDKLRAIVELNEVVFTEDSIDAEDAKAKKIYTIWYPYLKDLRKEIIDRQKQDSSTFSSSSSDEEKGSPPSSDSEKYSYILSALPEYDSSAHKKWLEDMRAWIEIDLENLEDESKEIKECKSAIQNLFRALSDLNSYISSFQELVDLDDKLKEIINVTK